MNVASQEDGFHLNTTKSSGWEMLPWVQKLIFILSFLPRRKYPAIFTCLTPLHEGCGEVWYGLHQSIHCKTSCRYEQSLYFRWRQKEALILGAN